MRIYHFKDNKVKEESKKRKVIRDSKGRIRKTSNNVLTYTDIKRMKGKK